MATYEEEMKRYYSDGGDARFRFNHDFLSPDSIVIDAGGYIGSWAEEIYKKYKCNIYIFEPIYYLYNQIKYKFGNNEKIKVFNLALSDENKTDRLYIYDNASSFYVTKDQFVDVIKIKISDFIRSENISKIDLFKLNVEGDEYAILLDMIENDMIKLVKKFQIQYHELTDNYSEKRSKINEYLVNNGYKQLFNYDFIWEEWEK